MRPSRIRRTLIASLAFVAAFSACRQPVEEPTEGPRLVLLIVVDQMRADYLDRLRPLFTAGLARLLDESVVFAETRYGHAVTTTAPGHATLATGLHPSRHGIVDNVWYEEGEEVYCVGDERYDRSPRRLEAPTLGDWIKAQSRRSKVFAVSGKDRAAILLGGLEADAAYWYDRWQGSFTSSDYYGDRRAGWLDDLARRGSAAAHFGEGWQPLAETAAVLADAERRAAYGIGEIDYGAFEVGFPHLTGWVDLGPSEDFYGDLYNSPVVDELTAEAALALIDGEGLGEDGWVDFLGVSFSALDTVGHRYGPNSPEALDTVLRLDRSLGELLDGIDERIGLDRTVVALSADHGVATMPEDPHRTDGARRVRAADLLCIQRVGRTLREDYGRDDLLLPGPALAREVLEEEGLDPSEVAARVERRLEACPAIERAWTEEELATSDEPMASLYRASYLAGRSGDFLLQPASTVLFRTTGTTHGTPYPFDTEVPWLLRVAGYRGAVAEPAQPVDVAPTLAALAGIAVPAGLDGVDRSTALAALREVAPPVAAGD